MSTKAGRQTNGKFNLQIRMQGFLVPKHCGCVGFFSVRPVMIKHARIKKSQVKYWLTGGVFLVFY